MSKIQIKNITKKYGRNNRALSNFSFESKVNEFIVILGASGSGKTTLLNVIAGFEKPNQGNIIVDGIDITQTDPKDRDIAMVFQDYALYSHMTVYDNISFFLKLHNFKKKDIQKKVKAISEILQIDDLLDRKPETLSGGQKQRVAIARALIREPKVFLMDEPLSNLDVYLKAGRLHKNSYKILQTI